MNMSAGVSPTRMLLMEAAIKLSRKRGVAPILKDLFRVIFGVTPAERAAVLVDNTLWERERYEDEERVGARRSVVDDVFKDGKAVIADDRKMLCLPMEAFENRQGAIYAEVSESSSAVFDENALVFMKGLAPVSAGIVDDAIFIDWLKAQNAKLREDERLRHRLIGEGPVITKLRETIAKAARTNSTVLLQAESGTGKEVVAHTIHAASQRAEGLFVAISAAAIPDNLLESQLFGHEKGSFTGATAQKKGDCEIASGGTLFLDEIGELPLPLQAKLLRVLQEGEIQRVGGTRPIKVDLRVVAATNVDLKQAVAKKLFREDLYYRLNVIALRTPPLREHPEDIPALAQHFLENYSQKAGSNIRRIHPKTEAMLRNYQWPGNVRQLENVIQSAIAFGSGDTIFPEDLPEELFESPGARGYHQQVRDAKKTILERAVAEAGGNLKLAAERLELHDVSSLHHLLDKHGLDHLKK